jgi:hypothetical protein
MGRRYKFELFYPADCLPDALNAMEGMQPTWRRKRTGKPMLPPWGMNLRGLTPDAPMFAELGLLFPADEFVRGYCDPDADSEWTDEGVECLPVGPVDLTVRVGRRYGQLTFAARVSMMSDVFENSPGVWERFAWLLRAGGGVIGLFNDMLAVGSRHFPLLPDGSQAVALDYRDFILEHRPTYWHLDVDRFATAALEAPKVAGA